MDPEAGNVLITALHGLALAGCVLALGASALTWHLSRAGVVRTFESRVYGQLENAASRLERIESQWLEERTHLQGLTDEMAQSLDRVSRERKRLGAENQRAGIPRNGGAPPGGVDIHAPREEQLRQVAAIMGGQS